MKKQNTFFLIWIVLGLGALIGYRAWDSYRGDTVAPVLSLPQTVQEVTGQDQSQLLQYVTAWDDRDGDVTDSVVVERVTLESGDGTATVVCAAFDRAGNVSKGSFTVRYTDYQTPRFSLSQPLVFTYGTSFDIFSVISCTDAVDGTLDHRIRATSLDETSVAAMGDHRVLFRVTNSMDQTVELELPVRVIASGTYHGSLTLKEYLTYLPQGEAFDAAAYLVDVTVSGKTVSFQGGIPDGYQLEITGAVDPNTPGAYPVDYTITCTQSNGNTVTAYSRLIVVVEG